MQGPGDYLAGPISLKIKHHDTCIGPNPLKKSSYTPPGLNVTTMPNLTQCKVVHVAMQLPITSDIYPITYD